MAFDRNDTVPSINPRKKTTKVNLGVVIGVILFFAVCMGAIMYFTQNPHTTVPKEERKAP